MTHNRFSISCYRNSLTEFECSVYSITMQLFTVTQLLSCSFFLEISLDVFGEYAWVYYSMVDSRSYCLSHQFPSSGNPIDTITSHNSSYRSSGRMVPSWCIVYLLVWRPHQCCSEGMHRFNSECDWGDGTRVYHFSNSSRGPFSLWDSRISCEREFADDASECPFIAIDDPISGCIHSR